MRKIKRRPTIDSFSGHYRFLSNFYQDNIYFRGRFWPSAEHAFQAMKNFDVDYQEMVRRAATCKLAKQYGRQVKLRDDWEEVKDEIMYEIVYLKFYQGHQKTQLLLNTRGKRLVEGNIWHDNYWGNCTCPRCWGKVGQNKLGKILMRVRTELLWRMPVWMQPPRRNNEKEKTFYQKTLERYRKSSKKRSQKKGSTGRR